MHSADIQDRDGGVLVMATLFGLHPFLLKLYADGGYQGPIFQSALRKILRQIDVEIVKRSDIAKGFAVLPKRWIVERTIAWLNRCRRLAKDWECLNRKALAFLRLASIRLMLRKLVKKEHDLGQTLTDETSDAIKAAGKAALPQLRELEVFALGINSGVYDLETFNKISGSWFLQQVRWIKRYIDLQQEQNPDVYKELVGLAEAIDDIRSAVTKPCGEAALRAALMTVSKRDLAAAARPTISRCSSRRKSRGDGLSGQSGGLGRAPLLCGAAASGDL